MKKNSRISSIITAALLTVFALASLLACQEPVMVTRKKTADQTTDTPAPITGAPTAELPPFTLTYDGKNAVSLSPFQTLASSGRSLGGYDQPGVIALDGGTLNYFQWVFMDEAADGALYAFDYADGTDSTHLVLNAAVVPGHTYHVLLLAGYNPGGVDPTLLASGYTKFIADASTGSLQLTLIPVVVDVKFSDGSNEVRQVGRLAKTVGLDAGQTYTLEYFIGSDNKGVKATNDALKQASDDGLWPLKLATPDVRTDDTWRYKYSTPNSSGVLETVKTYQPGVLDTVEVPLNNARGANLAWVQWDGDDKVGMNDLNVNQSKQTTGRGEYALTINKSHATPGVAWVNLEYVPFAVFDDAAWKAVSGNRLSERPVWVIRNGLNDTKQDAATWTSGMTYNSANGNGGIAIGVVDPATPFPAGLFEDNNPWPIAGTEGKTSVEIRDWVNAYCAAQTPAITTTTLAGIHAAKYGDYTLLPRRYYAAPLSGNEPIDSNGVHGLTGTAVNGGASWTDANSVINDVVNFAAVNYALSAQTVEIWAAAGTYTSTAINVSGGTDHLRIYGGFKGTETAPLGSLPAGRDGWFNTHAFYNNTLAIGNEYGKVRETARKTTLDGGGGLVVVSVDGATDFVLDGFTITGNAGAIADAKGLYISGGTTATVFRNLDVAGSAGYGIHSEGNGSAPLLENLSVTGKSGVATNTGIWLNGDINAAPVLRNVRVSGITAAAYSGIYIQVPNTPQVTASGTHPYMENIVVTGNKTTGTGYGAGIRNNAETTIVNAIVSGNESTHTGSGSSMACTGGIYTATNLLTLVNVLVSGNKVSITAGTSNNADGGGGIKVYGGFLTLINCTVSGNYANRTSGPTHGAGILAYNAYVPVLARSASSVVKIYNSIVAGNAGLTDIMTFVGTTPPRTSTYNAFYAYNSIVGGYTAAQLATSGDILVPSIFSNYPGFIGAGSGNVDGTPYRVYGVPTLDPIATSPPYYYVAAGDPSLALSAGNLSALQQLFVSFPDFPSVTNTGLDYANWDFHLKAGSAAVDKGSTGYLGAGFQTMYEIDGTDRDGLPYQIVKDLDGATRVQSGTPDLGVYER